MDTSGSYGAAVQFLAVADGESRLVAALTNGSFLVWDLPALVAGAANPVQVSPPGDAAAPVRDVVPNPAERGELCAAVFGNAAYLLDVRTGQWNTRLPLDGVTAASWSAKGKQIVLGNASGELHQLTPTGESKDVLPAPPEADRPLRVDDVRWLENDVFLVTYNTASTDPEPVHEYDVYAVLRDRKAGTTTYAAFPLDIPPPFGDTSRAGRRYVASLKGWNPMKHLVFMANAPSTDVGALGCKISESDVSAWNALELEETSRPVLPFSSVDPSADTAPVAIDLDLTATEPIEDPNAAAKGEDPSKKLASGAHSICIHERWCAAGIQCHQHRHHGAVPWYGGC